jgi:ABC-type phosphate transport system substrate-binding protein
LLSSCSITTSTALHTSFTDVIPPTNTKYATPEFNISHFAIEERYAKIAINFPKVGGSYAVEPLWWSIICEIYNINCAWDGNNLYYPLGPNSLELRNYIYQKYTNMGSDDLLQSLLDNKLDIIITTRSPIAYEEQHQLIPGTELIYLPIAENAFVFVVSSLNPVDDLRISDIQDLYSGKIINWNQLGEYNELVTLYQQELPFGSEGIMDAQIMKENKRKIGEEVLEKARWGYLCTMVYPFSGTNDPVGDKSGIGYGLQILFRNYLGYELKQLTIDGIPPTPITIDKRIYPLYVEFYIVMRKNDTNEINNMLFDYLHFFFYESTGLLSPYYSARNN